MNTEVQDGIDTKKQNTQMEKINKFFQKILKKSKIDGYLVPKNDEFFEEYVPEYRDRLKYISNFQARLVFLF